MKNFMIRDKEMISGIISILLMCVVAYIERKQKSTIFIYSIWSIGVYLIYLLSYNYMFVPFSDHYWLIFTLFIACFYIGYQLIKWISTSVFVYIPTIKVKGINYLFFFTIAILTSTVVNAIHFHVILNSSYSNLRELILSGQINTSPAIANALMCALMYYTNITDRRKLTKIAVAVYLFITAVLSTTKLFTVIAILYIVPWYKEKFKINIKTIVLISIIGIMGFSLVNVSRGNIVGDYDTLLGNILYTMLGYLCGGLAAFQSILEGIPLEDGWIWTGKWYGNVYTMFYHMYIKESTLLFCVNSMILGAIYGAIYKKSVFNNYLNIYGLYPLFFMYFGMMFTLRQWVVFIFAGIIMTITYNNERNRINRKG